MNKFGVHHTVMSCTSSLFIITYNIHRSKLTCCRMNRLDPYAIITPTVPDIEIPSNPRRITEIISALGIIYDNDYDLYEKYKAKIHSTLKSAPPGHYVVVAGITPTSLGEGKSTACIGLSHAIGAHLGRKVFTCIRNPVWDRLLGLREERRGEDMVR